VKSQKVALKALVYPHSILSILSFSNINKLSHLSACCCPYNVHLSCHFIIPIMSKTKRSLVRNVKGRKKIVNFKS